MAGQSAAKKVATMVVQKAASTAVKWVDLKAGKTDEM